MMMDEDPFNQAFGGGGTSAALELEAGHVREPEPPPAEAPPPEPETPGQQRARQIVEIAAYGQAPAKLLGTPGYCVRVILRKRVLTEELAALSAQRKRADDQVTEALQKLGETLYGLRRDPRLSSFAKLLAAVSEAESQVGQVEAQGKKRKHDAEHELARLDRELQKLELRAAPLRQRETEIGVLLSQQKTELKRAELQRRKVETELEAIERAKTPVDPERIAALKAERDARHGEVQTLGIEMRPLEDDLNALRRELAQLMRAVAAVRDEKQVMIAAQGRVQQNLRVSTGSALGARAQALTALANAVLRQGQKQLAPDPARVALESQERAERKRQQEDLHRSALSSYDQKAYGLGLRTLLGGSLFFFLSLALMILF